MDKFGESRYPWMDGLGCLFTTLRNPTDSLEPKILDLIKCIEHTKKDANFGLHAKYLIDDILNS